MNSWHLRRSVYELNASELYQRLCAGKQLLLPGPVS